MNSVIKDIIGSSTLNTYGAVSFAKDRYRNIKSSLFLNGSNATISDFDSGNGFTIMLWFKLQDTSTVSLIQCLINNVLAFTVNFGYSTDYPAIELVTSNETKSYDMTNYTVPLLARTSLFHLAVTVDPINITLFINGKHVAQVKSETFQFYSKLSCEIVKEMNSSSYPEAKVYIDEVKIFDAPIDQYMIAIHKEMNETNIDKNWIRKFVRTSKLIR